MKEIIYSLLFLGGTWAITCLIVHLFARAWNNHNILVLVGLASFVYLFCMFWQVGAHITMYEGANIVGILMVFELVILSMFKAGWKGWLGFGLGFLAGGGHKRRG